MDVPDQWLDQDTQDAFTHRSGVIAPVVVITATKAILGGDPAVFIHTSMESKENEVTWEVVAVTTSRLVTTRGTRGVKHWHAGEAWDRGPEPQVNASARPMTDTVAVDLADVKCRKRGNLWEMTGRFTATFSDDQTLILDIDHRDEAGRKFTELMNLFSRALAASSQRRD